MKKMMAIGIRSLWLPWVRRKVYLICAALASGASHSMPAELDYFEISGGSRVIHIQKESANSVVLQAYWPSRWHFVDELNPVVPVITTQVLLTGTAEGMNASELRGRLEELQVQRSITATSEEVIGSVVAPANNFEEVTKLLNLVLANPEFNLAEINRVKQNFQVRIQNLRSGIDSTAWELARNLILQDSPVKRYFSTSVSSEVFTDAATITEMRQFFNETLTRRNATVIIASPFDSDRISDAVDGLLVGIPEGDLVEVPRTTVDFPAGTTVVLHNPDAERSYLALAGLLPPISQGHEFEDTMALLLLGQGGNSILYNALRTELGATYEFTSSVLSLTNDLRLMQIAGTVDTNKLTFAHQTIRKEYEAFRRSGPQSSLDGIKRRLSNNMRISMENPAILVSLVLESLTNGFPATHALQRISEIEAITENSMRERLNGAFPALEELMIVIVTPEPDLIPGACVIESPQEYRECL